MSKPILTQAYLRSLFDYDPETGVFTRRDGKPLRQHITTSGYGQLFVAGKRYATHRLAWLYAYGVFPSGHIDHLDGVRLSNALANLRDVTQAVNNQNRRTPRTDSQTGLIGVGFSYGRWTARISVDGKRIRLGRFSTPQLAHQAYLAAKRSLHSACTI